jgi:hypothetical protein
MRHVATSPAAIWAVEHFGGIDGKVHGVVSAVLPIAAARATDGAVIIATTTAA